MKFDGAAAMIEMTSRLTEAAENLKPALSVLPPADRLALANYLFDSLENEENISEEEYHAEWEAELLRRIKETEMGLDVEISAEEVHRMIRESLSGSDNIR